MQKFILFVLIINLNANTQQDVFIIEDSMIYKKQMQSALAFTNINIDSTIFYANNAYITAKKSNNYKKEIKSLFLIIKNQIIKGNVAAAINNCFIADSLSKSNDISEYEADILLYTGNAYIAAGYVSEGLAYLYRAKNIVGDNHYLHSEIDYYISSATFQVNDTVLSRKYARSAINRNLAYGDSTFAIKNYLLLANSFEDQDSIIKYFQLAELILKKSESQYKRAVLLNNKAFFYDEIGKINIANRYYIEAIRIARTNNFKDMLSNLFNNYAYLMIAEKKFDSAYILLNNALVIARELENIDLEASVLDSFSDYYAIINDSTKSFNYYKESVVLRKEYQKQKQVEKSLFLSTVFETEKKEQQLISKQSEINQARAIIFGVLLLLTVALSVLIYFRQKSITRRTRLLSMEKEKMLEVANALLEGQDAERKRLAMDLHDGISPKMGALKMVIETEFRNNDNLPGVINSLDEINQEIREMSHKMLPTQLESKGLVVAIENFINLLKKFQNKCSIDFYHNLTARLNRKLEVNLFYITYELINNAIKHSESSEIVLQLLLDKNELFLTVEDNGVGFNSKKDSDGLGLSNLKQRVQYLDGKLLIDSRIGEGTEITVKVKT